MRLPISAIPKLPSSDPPGERAQRCKKPRSGRSQGAQPGHLKHERALIGVVEGDAFERFYPSDLCRYGRALVIALEPVVHHHVFDVVVHAASEQ